MFNKKLMERIDLLGDEIVKLKHQNEELNSNNNRIMEGIKYIMLRGYKYDFILMVEDGFAIIGHKKNLMISNNGSLFCKNSKAIKAIFPYETFKFYYYDKNYWAIDRTTIYEITCSSRFDGYATEAVDVTKYMKDKIELIESDGELINPLCRIL